MKLYKMGWFLSQFPISAITLFPRGIYFKKDYHFNNPVLVNHEKTHWEQQIEMFIAGIFISLILGVIFLLLKLSLWWFIILLVFPFIFFYAWYFFEWLFKLLTPPVGAYKDISFEREANENENNLEYPKIRKYFSWRKYMTKKKIDISNLNLNK